MLIFENSSMALFADFSADRVDYAMIRQFLKIRTFPGFCGNFCALARGRHAAKMSSASKIETRKQTEKVSGFRKFGWRAVASGSPSAAYASAELLRIHWIRPLTRGHLNRGSP